MAKSGAYEEKKEAEAADANSDDKNRDIEVVY